MNMEAELKQLLSKITPLDQAAMAKARERQAQLAKPPGSLGRLEDLSVAGIMVLFSSSGTIFACRKSPFSLRVTSICAAAVV